MSDSIDRTRPVLSAEGRRPQPRTRTGTCARNLVEAVRADLGELEELVGKARARIGHLEEETRGINGLSAACRGWGQQLDQLLRDLTEEAGRVEKTMIGGGRPITESVDQVLVEQITLARGA